MKEFNYEAAKAGAPVCTRDGRPARITDWNFDNNKVKMPILAIIGPKGDEFTSAYYINGRSNADVESPHDLMMASIKHEGWINLYQLSGGAVGGGIVYDTEEDARNKINNNERHVAIIKIEWEK